MFDRIAANLCLCVTLFTSGLVLGVLGILPIYHSSVSKAYVYGRYSVVLEVIENDEWVEVASK